MFRSPFFVGSSPEKVRKQRKSLKNQLNSEIREKMEEKFNLLSKSMKNVEIAEELESDLSMLPSDTSLMQ